MEKVGGVGCILKINMVNCDGDSELVCVHTYRM